MVGARVGGRLTFGGLHAGVRHLEGALSSVDLDRDVQVRDDEGEQPGAHHADEHDHDRQANLVPYEAPDPPWLHRLLPRYS